MGRFFSVIGPIVGLAFVGVAMAPHVVDDSVARLTLLALAGGIFTIALAVRIRE
jgi:hypothetical protein